MPVGLKRASQFFAVTCSVCDPGKKSILCHACFPKSKMVAAICAPSKCCDFNKMTSEDEPFFEFYWIN